VKWRSECVKKMADNPLAEPGTPLVLLLGLGAMPAVTRVARSSQPWPWGTQSRRDWRGSCHSTPLLLGVEFPKGIGGTTGFF